MDKLKKYVLLDIKSKLLSSRFYQKNFLILREFKYIWKSFFAGVFFSITASLFEGASIALLLSYVRDLSSQSSEISQTGIHLVDEIFLGINDTTEIRFLKISILIIVITLLRAVFIYFGTLNLNQSQIRIVENIRFRIFEQLAKLHLSFYTNSRSGDLVSVMTTEINSLKTGMQGFSVIISRGVYIPLYLIYLASISIELAIMTIILLTAVPFSLIHIRRKITLASIAVTSANKWISSLTIEFVSGIQTIQSFSSQNHERRRFNAAINESSQALDNQIRWQALAEPTSEFLGFATIISILYYAQNILGLPFSTIIGFIYILMRLTQVTKQINTSIVGISVIHGSIESIKMFLSDKNKPLLSTGSINFAGLQSEIRFDGVTFGYEPNKCVLNKIDLSIQKGKNYAFVGTSGSGKSTIVNLLLRLYDPISGSITIDGIKINHFDIESLHKKMAIVSQDTFLFNASVRDNIAYGLFGVSEQRIIEAAKLAYALEFIELLPNGFDTLLGDRGVRLSGGQRQRIAIARAILRDPEILILDEATSALDNESEGIVQSAINQASQNRTVVVVAHRLTTIQSADEIVVLDKGKIIEKGNYDQLILEQGSFWKLQNYTERKSLDHVNGES